MYLLGHLGAEWRELINFQVENFHLTHTSVYSKLLCGWDWHPSCPPYSNIRKTKGSLRKSHGTLSNGFGHCLLQGQVGFSNSLKSGVPTRNHAPMVLGPNDALNNATQLGCLVPLSTAFREALRDLPHWKTSTQLYSITAMNLIQQGEGLTAHPVWLCPLVGPVGVTQCQSHVSWLASARAAACLVPEARRAAWISWGWEWDPCPIPSTISMGWQLAALCFGAAHLQIWAELAGLRRQCLTHGGISYPACSPLTQPAVCEGLRKAIKLLQNVFRSRCLTPSHSSRSNK